MKKTTIIIIIAVLCSIFKANAQDTEAIDITTKGIQTGQKSPDFELTNIQNHTAKNIRLSDLKGKLVILDFWATWCAPCISAVPKMNKLQKQFEGKIQMLSVTYQNEKDVTGFFSKLPDSLRPTFPLKTVDTALSVLFPHKFLPHYVWIDGQGTVRAITGLDGISAKNISAMLENQTADIQQKHDFSLTYDDQKPFLLEGNGGPGKDLRFHSVLTGYQQGLPSRYTTYKGKQISGARITFLNVSIPHLFAYAMGANKGAFNFKNMRFQVKDKSGLTMTGDHKKWLAEHTFCYELIVPESLESDKYSIMLIDLKRMFPEYKVSTETTKQNVLALIRSNQSDKIKSKGGAALSAFDATGFELRNFPISRLVAQLSTSYLQNNPLPIVDDTGYIDRVNLKITAPLSDVQALNNALEPYGLALEEKQKEIEILVFRDK